MDDTAEDKDGKTGMGCVLRVYGDDDFGVDGLLRQISIKPCIVHRKGERSFGPKSRIQKLTRFHAITSEADVRDLPGQVNDTILFLNDHADDLLKIMSFAGVSGAMLDFSVESRIGRNRVFAQNDFLPPELVALAGKFGLGINLTLYPPPDDPTYLHSP